MNHVTSVAWTGVCAVKKVIERNPFYYRGIFIFTHCAQNCMVVLGMKAGAYVGQISDQAEGEGCAKKKEWIFHDLNTTVFVSDDESMNPWTHDGKHEADVWPA